MSGWGLLQFESGRAVSRKGSGRVGVGPVRERFSWVGEEKNLVMRGCCGSSQVGVLGVLGGSCKTAGACPRGESGNSGAVMRRGPRGCRLASS